MVALQVLVLSVVVRIRLGQRKKRRKFFKGLRRFSRDIQFCFCCLAEEVLGQRKINVDMHNS